MLIDRLARSLKKVSQESCVETQSSGGLFVFVFPMRSARRVARASGTTQYLYSGAHPSR